MTRPNPENITRRPSVVHTHAERSELEGQSPGALERPQRLDTDAHGPAGTTPPARAPLPPSQAHTAGGQGTPPAQGLPAQPQTEQAVNRAERAIFLLPLNVRPIPSGKTRELSAVGTETLRARERQPLVSTRISERERSAGAAAGGAGSVRAHSAATWPTRNDLGRFDVDSPQGLCRPLGAS